MPWKGVLKPVRSDTTVAGVAEADLTYREGTATSNASVSDVAPCNDPDAEVVVASWGKEALKLS